MTTPTANTIPIVVFGYNASDDALTCNLPDEIDDQHNASISKETHDAIVAAKQALEANPGWDSIAVTSDMECKPLEEALDAADMWRTGSENFLVYRFGGLYLRLLHRNNRQADIEFEVVRPDGRPVIPETSPQDSLTLYFLSDKSDRPENRDLFVWAKTPKEAVTFWRGYYQIGPGSHREPDNIWPVPLDTRVAGAVKWNNPEDLMTIAC